MQGWDGPTRTWSDESNGIECPLLRQGISGCSVPQVTFSPLPSQVGGCCNVLGADVRCLLPR